MPRSRASKREIFLSHSSRDRAFVVRLARVLKQHNIRHWYSATHIAGGQQWHDEIGEALARCDWFIVVLTPNAVRSVWVKRELVFALSQDRYNDRIIPILRKPCDYPRLSWALPEFQLVDFTGDFGTGCRQLLRIWNVNYTSPSGTPCAKPSDKTCDPLACARIEEKLPGLVPWRGEGWLAARSYCAASAWVAGTAKSRPRGMRRATAVIDSPGRAARLVRVSRRWLLQSKEAMGLHTGDQR